MKQFLVIFAALLCGACEKEDGEEMVVIPPHQPTDVLLVQDGSLLVLTWNDVANNEDGYVIARGSRKYGWMNISNLNPNSQEFIEDITNLNDEFLFEKIGYLVIAYNDAGNAMEVSNEITIQK